MGDSSPPTLCNLPWRGVSWYRQMTSGDGVAKLLGARDAGRVETKAVWHGLAALWLDGSVHARFLLIKLALLASDYAITCYRWVGRCSG